MSSAFISAPEKFTSVFGQDIDSPIYMQFVPGVVVHVVTFPDANRGGSSKTTNSIIAKPWIQGEGIASAKLTDLGDEFRYLPLLRGFADVPCKGDPVLLCSIGERRFYLGPINGDNSPNFNDDYMYRYESSIFDTYEELYAKEQSEKGITSRTFLRESVNRLQKKSHTELDVPEKSRYNTTRGDIHGDMMFEGRHGNSIRIGSRNIHPYIFISNHRSIANSVESLGDGSIISITSDGAIGQHFSPHMDIENGTMVGFQLASDAIETPVRTIEKMVDTVNGFYDSEYTRLNMYGYGSRLYQNKTGNKKTDQMLLHSDRITINTKSDDIYLSSMKDIHIGTGRHLTISSHKNLIIEAENTFLGNPDTGQETREMEPMILGNQLLEVLVELVAALKGSQGLCTGAPIPLADETGAPGGIKAKMTSLEQKLELILSQHHYIEPNR
tara:strand:+ start:1724 stop:3046 length:1323 start_codon:yes stop_codon:yes gene_type:complete